MTWSRRGAHRHLYAVAVAVALLLRAPPGAADTVKGYVLDALQESRVPDVEVAFLIPGEDGELSEMVRRTTDGDGAFAFSGPFLSTGTSFALVAYYDGLEFATGTLEVGAQDQIIVEVYDGTEDPAEVRIDAHHLFLSVTETGIDVAQIVHIDNLGEATYMGRAFGDERRVFELALPEGNLALNSRDAQISRAGANRVFDTRPLPPGRTQVTVTFQVQGNVFDGVYEHEVLYPTERLDVFLQPASVTLAAPFQDLGEVPFHDQSYRHYRLEQLSPGRTVSIRLPYSRPLRWTLKWAMLVLVPAVLAGTAAIARPMVSAGGEAAGDDERSALERRRRVLLGTLAGLDTQLTQAEGDVARQLQQQREQVAAQAVDVYRRLGLGG